MAQFDVHRVGGPAAAFAPYLVELQSPLLGSLATVVVAPLRPSTATPASFKTLHARLSFQGQTHELAVEELASLPRTQLGPCVGSVAEGRREIIAALDLLFTGY